jgi:hypothetical protein
MALAFWRALVSGPSAALDRLLLSERVTQECLLPLRVDIEGPSGAAIYRVLDIGES